MRSKNKYGGTSVKLAIKNMEDHLGEHLLIGYLTVHGYIQIKLDFNQGFGNKSKIYDIFRSYTSGVQISLKPRGYAIYNKTHLRFVRKQVQNHKKFALAKIKQNKPIIDRLTEVTAVIENFHALKRHVRDFKRKSKKMSSAGLWLLQVFLSFILLRVKNNN